MTQNEKAVIRLNSIDIPAFEDNDTVYITVEETNLEIAIYEIEHQATRFNECIKEDPTYFG